MKPSFKLYAMTSRQGTACRETVLCENEYTAKNRRLMEDLYCNHRDPDAPEYGTWCDVSDNEAMWPE